MSRPHMKTRPLPSSRAWPPSAGCSTWLVLGQVVAWNPASTVRGPTHVVKRGKTPVLRPEEVRLLLNSIDASAAAGLRDRALVADGGPGFAPRPLSATAAARPADGGPMVSRGGSFTVGFDPRITDVRDVDLEVVENF